MHRLLIIISVFFLSYLVIFNICEAHSEDHSKSIASILDSAEKFFISLKEGKYSTAWDLLSEKSHETIINDIYETSRKRINKEDIMKDFKSRGVMFNNYWNAFLGSFDTDMVLEHSRWEKGFIKKNKAEILITYKKSDRPTRLKMYREKGMWKIGLVETFWTRKKMKFLDIILQ